MWLLFAVLMVAGWSVPVVVNSMIVSHYEKNPFVLLVIQSCFSLSVIAIAAAYVPLSSAWIPYFVAGAVLAYAGDVLFFLALDRMDASVFNIVWAFLAVLLSVVGFVWFGETWSPLQTAAALFILFGVLLLSYWHRHLSPQGLCILLAMALLYVPNNAFEKAALDAGEAVSTVLFWQVIVREMLCFCFPWFLPGFRASFRRFRGQADARFLLLCAVAVFFFFVGLYFSARAYQVGSLSLVSVVGNIQPFVVLSMAWLVWRLWPRYASRELLDGQSLQAKLLGFGAVFFGMTLLVLG